MPLTKVEQQLPRGRSTTRLRTRSSTECVPPSWICQKIDGGRDTLYYREIFRKKQGDEERHFDYHESGEKNAFPRAWQA